MASYAPALCFQFLTFDDQAYVTENRHVQKGLTFKNLEWAFSSVTAGNWQPVTMISHMADCQIYGLRPWGHHLTNLLLHAANAALVYLLLWRMTRGRWRSACVAALFAVHPTRIESVAWIAERKDVLCGLFFLLAAWCYVRYAKEQKNCRRRRSFYALIIALFALALMSKPMAVTLPFVLLLLDYWPLARFGKPGGSKLIFEKLPLLAMSAADCAVTIWAQRRGHALASVQSLPLAVRMTHAFGACLDYVRLMFFPVRLAVFYPYRLHQASDQWIFGVVVVALATVATVLCWRRWPFVSMGWLWFVGMLFPVIGLVQVGGQGWADRYTYLPAIGLFVALVWGGAELARRMPALSLLAPVALAGCLVATEWQLPYWHDTLRLFTRAMDVTDGNYLAMTMVGSIQADTGHLREAVALYREALGYQPDYAEAHLFLGRALERAGDKNAALQEYEKAALLKPELAEANVLRGLLLAGELKYREAEACYAAAAKSDPESAAAENDWGRALQSQGLLRDSVRHYERALALNPTLAEAHNNIGIEYLQMGDLTAGIEELRAAHDLNPDNGQTTFNLGQALNQAGKWAPAAALLKDLAGRQPGDAKLQYQYGLALEHLGQTRTAMGCFAAAILDDQNFAEALNALAWLAATSPEASLRNGGQAVELAARACKLTENQRPEMLLTIGAAYAEQRRFDEAATVVMKALEMARERQATEIEENARQVLTAIKARRPFYQ